MMTRAPRGVGAVRLLALVMGASLLLLPNLGWAETFAVDPETYYEVSYQLNEAQSRTVKAVKVSGIVTIGKRE